jgi:hypothetical protein
LKRFIIFTLRQILFEWSSQGGGDDAGHVACMGEKCGLGEPILKSTDVDGRIITIYVM